MDTKPVVWVIEDDPLVCRALAQLFGTAGLDCRSFSNASDFLDAFDPQEPACILLDMQLPGINGLELQEILVERGCKQPIIFITGHAEVPLAVRAMKCGAVDFIQKPFSERQLFNAVGQALNSFAETWENEKSRKLVKDRIRLLSPRERQVLTLVVSGKSTKQIAGMLGLSCKTVDNHRASILDKMEAVGVADLVRLTLQAEPDILARRSGSDMPKHRPDWLVTRTGMSTDYDRTDVIDAHQNGVTEL